MAEVQTGFYQNVPQVNPLERIKQVGDIAQQAVGIEQAKLNLINQRFGIMTKQLSTFANDPNATPDKIMQWGQNLVKQGLIPAKMWAQEVAQLPAPTGNAQQDAAALQAHLKQKLISMGNTQEAVNWQYGQQNLVDRGGQLQPIVSSPMFGVRESGAPIAKTLSPTERGAPVEIVGPNNERQIITRENALRRQGQPLGPAGEVPSLAPGQAAPIAPPAPQVQNPLVKPSARSRPAGNPLGSPQTPPVAVSPPPVVQAPAPAATAPTGLTTALPPGVPEAATAVGGASGQQLAADRAESAGLLQNSFPLREAIPKLEKLGPTGTGPLTEGRQEIKSALVSLGILKPTEDVKTYDEARKYLTQFARQNGNTGTNDQLASAFAGSPSVGISNASAVDLAKAALAIQRMRAAAPLAFAATGKPPEKYSEFLQEYRQTQDPRAFGIDFMTPAQRNKLLDTMSAEEKQKFLRNVNQAKKLGIVSLPTEVK